MRPAMRNIAGLELDVAGNRWHGLCDAGFNSLVGPEKRRLSPGHLFSMDCSRTWHHHRVVDLGEILDHRVTSNFSLATRAHRRGASTKHIRLESAGRTARRSRLVGYPGQPDDMGTNVPIGTARRGLS